MNNLIIAFQELVPQLQNGFRGRLGSGYGSAGFQFPVKFFLTQVDPFKIGLSFYHKGHGQYADTQLLRLLLGDAAVTVRDNCNL